MQNENITELENESIDSEKDTEINVEHEKLLKTLNRERSSRQDLEKLNKKIQAELQKFKEKEAIASTESQAQAQTQVQSQVQNKSTSDEVNENEALKLKQKASLLQAELKQAKLEREKVQQQLVDYKINAEVVNYENAIRSELIKAGVVDIEMGVLVAKQYIHVDKPSTVEDAVEITVLNANKEPVYYDSDSVNKDQKAGAPHLVNRILRTAHPSLFQQARAGSGSSATSTTVSKNIGGFIGRLR